MTLRAFVDSAKNIDIIAGMQKFKRDFLPSLALLDHLNPLKNDASSAIANHFKTVTPIPFSFDDASTYLAASSFVHCKDGWQYLSDAVDCIFKGDFKTAVHLSYYAELRAANAFLASEGIGVFNNVHFCIHSGTNIIQDPYSHYNTSQHRFNGSGTHSFMWKCLETFANSNNKHLDYLLETFWHNGISFDKWIANIPHANTISVISEHIKQWIKDWSFDINHFKDDREGRNNASYNPSKFDLFNVDDCKDSIDSYSNALRLLEPDSINRFSLLDKHLFKILFINIHAQIVRNGITISLSDLLDQTFVAMGKPMDSSLRSIILSPTDNPLITGSRDTIIDPSGNIKPFTIFSRALLLLRIATGSVAYLLKKAGVTNSDLKFFFDYCCVEHGFWKVGHMESDLTKLWDDLSDAIIEIDDWASLQTPPLDIKTLDEELASYLTTYKQINRVNCWGIAI